MVTALVTGAGSGIGEAVTSRFRREGARLLLTVRREQLDTARPDDLYVPGSLNDEAFVASLAQRAAESVGAVDVVVLRSRSVAQRPEPSQLSPRSLPCLRACVGSSSHPRPVRSWQRRTNDLPSTPGIGPSAGRGTREGAASPPTGASIPFDGITGSGVSGCPRA